MKNLSINSLALLLVFFTSASWAQVGIGTTTPKGALDITSTTNGFLMPRIALTASNVASPVINPATGTTALEIGTAVFNTATTGGTYGVIPGIYYWDGTNWVSQVHRYYETKFTQTSDLTVATSASYTNIPGLNSKSFTAPYTGRYTLLFSGYLGAGTVDNNSSKVGFVEGNFKMTINGTDYRKYSHSSSFYNSDTATEYYELFNETNINVNVYLTAGQTCTINCSYNGVADDNITENNAHVVGRSTALGNFCEVNVTYIGR
ncbi:hypothetical protein [Flavobacterium sp. GCM10023249]|uniref:hypothetical protein n=1 Tax=unclassified Flavobacterium TaxID=196869 RepID=UPI00361561E4